MNDAGDLSSPARRDDDGAGESDHPGAPMGHGGNYRGAVEELLP